MRREALTGLLVTSFACSIALATSGCNKNQGGSEGTPPTTTSAAQLSPDLAAGKAVLDANNCIRCHTLNGEGGRRGPELTHIGSEGKPPEWFAAFVKNPRSKNPRSGMPPFSNLSDKDLKALGSYLASLK